MNSHQEKRKPRFTNDDLIKRAKISESDIKAGKTINTKQLRIRMLRW